MRVHWLVVLGWVAGIGLAPGRTPAAETSSAGASVARRPLYAPHHPFGTERARRTLDASAAPATRTELSTARSKPDEGQAPPESRVPSAAAPAQPQPATAPSGSPAPLPPVESPLTAEQQARLAELLERYKADQITPQEYHRERARILRQR
ncbi:hypothetical protein [Limisphaera sp. VF-2]|jgi:hypothetical protein|uniref:hypothetical protein n=1 Tax=Limisphaera sp. VF-2 TaxID=3400418 RepID=UPI00175E483D